MTPEEKTKVNPKAPQQGAQAPQMKIDIAQLTFELKLPGNIVLDALNALKMSSEKFKTSFDTLNTYVTEGIKSHIKTMSGEPKTTENVEETKTETKED